MLQRDIQKIIKTKNLDYKYEEPSQSKEIIEETKEKDKNEENPVINSDQPIQKEDILSDDKNAYIYVHANYKGELKEERFTSFILSKLADTIINQFDKYIEFIQEKVSFIPIFSVSATENTEIMEKADGLALNIPEFKLDRDIEEKSDAIHLKEEVDISLKEWNKQEEIGGENENTRLNKNNSENSNPDPIVEEKMSAEQDSPVNNLEIIAEKIEEPKIEVTPRQKRLKGNNLLINIIILDDIIEDFASSSTKKFDTLNRHTTITNDYETTYTCEEIQT